MKYYFIFNPKAGKGDAIKQIRNVVANSKGKYDATFYETKAPLDATAYVKAICKEYPDEEKRFIACGGDGTINEVFSGAVGFKKTSVSLFPCGSGNDFCKVFGGVAAFKPEEIFDYKTIKCDLMKVGDRYSVNITNFGFDTTVARTINQIRDTRGYAKNSDYSKGVMKALLTAMRNKFTVIADGVTLNPKGVGLLCTLGNGQYVGGSFKCSPRAKIDDGLIEVCVFRPITRIKFVTILDTYTKGEHLDSTKTAKILKYVRAKKVEVISPDKDFAFSLDGEIIKSNHFTVEIMPGALNLAVPTAK